MHGDGDDMLAAGLLGRRKALALAAHKQHERLRVTHRLKVGGRLVGGAHERGAA